MDNDELNFDSIADDSSALVDEDAKVGGEDGNVDDSDGQVGDEGVAVAAGTTDDADEVQL